MIESVRLKNFQSHKDNTFHFTNGVNAIVGPSDSGKTAILRALRWLIWNRPLGDAFRSDWGGDTEVIVSIDGTSINRYKYNSKQGYKINKTDLKAIGTEVPEEVSAILNIDEVNLQQQFDKPFLLADSPGEVAQHFNKVAHLENIDHAIKSLTTWHRRLKQDSQSIAKQVNEYEDALNEYSFIPAMETALLKAEELQQQKEQQEKELDRLLQLSEHLEDVDYELQVLTPLLSFDKLIKTYDKLKIEQHELQTRKNALYALVKELDDVSIQLDKLHTFTALETCLNEVLELYAKRKKIVAEKRALSLLIGQVRLVGENLIEADEEVATLQKEYHDNFPDVCPLCGSKVKEK